MNRLKEEAVIKSDILLSGFVLLVLISLAFRSILFGGLTFQAAGLVPGVMNTGPYGFERRGVVSYDSVGHDPGGSGWQMVAETEKMIQEWKKGNIPLWNPGQMFGTPLLHNLQLSPLFPLRIFPFVFNTPFSWDLYKLLLIFVAGLSTFLFLRLWGLSRPACYLGAITYMFSGGLILHIDFSFSDVNCCFPMLLYFIERVIRFRGAFDVGGLGFVLGSLCLCGYPVPLFLVLVYSALYVIYRVFGEVRKGSVCGELILKLSSSLGLGFGLGSVLVVPGLWWLLNSANNRPPGVGHGGLPWFYWVSEIFPDITKLMIPGSLEWGGWIGFVAFVLAFVAIIRWKEGPLLFFGIATAICQLKLLHLPPGSWLGYLPFFDRMVFARYLQPQLVFSFTVLSAYGLQFVANERRLKRVALGLTVFFLGAGIGTLWYSQPNFLTQMGEGQKYSKTVFWVVAVSFLMVILFWRVKKPAFISYALLFLQFILLSGAVQYARPARYDPLTPAPYIEFLKGDDEKFRLVAVDHLLFPPYSSAFGLEDVRWMNAIWPKKYELYVRELLGSREPDRFTGVEADFKLLTDAGFLNPYLSLANTKYLLALHPLPDISKKDLTLVYDKEIFIYRNEAVLPRAYLTTGVHLAKDETEQLTYLKSLQFEFSRPTVLSKGSESLSKALAANDKVEILPAKIVEYSTQKIRIESEANRPVFMVLSDMFSPKWEAFVDGVPVESFQTNLCFRGVYLSSGKHEVLFRYRDRLFEWCLGISVLCLSIILLLLGYGIREGYLTRSLGKVS